jgi:hypothetical protein
MTVWSFGEDGLQRANRLRPALDADSRPGRARRIRWGQWRPRIFERRRVGCPGWSRAAHTRLAHVSSRASHDQIPEGTRP